jgi:hypothetical protein
MSHFATRATLSSPTEVSSSLQFSIRYWKQWLGLATDQTSSWQEESRAGTRGVGLDQRLPI